MKFKKVSTVLAASCILIVALVCIINYRLIDGESNNYSIEVYEVNSGYGYRILEGKNILIKQDFVPVVQNQLPFPTYEIAKSSARLVIHKITSGENPALSYQDLRELGVKF